MSGLRTTGGRAARRALLAGLAASLVAAFPVAPTVFAQQAPVRVRGEVLSFDGAVLGVRTREAGDVKVELAKNVSVAARRPLSLADLKPGRPLGVTATRQGDAKLVAREIQVFPGSTAPNPGHRPMDDGATMTNASITATVSGASGRELTLAYPGGSQQVVVPEDALIYTTVDAERSLLAPGALVTLLATPSADGRLTASRVQVTRR